ncbi:MazG-like pyrophosphatase [Escherichia phage 241]|nr:MazG-like pyrophosphatase [Escherichia phage 241]
MKFIRRILETSYELSQKEPNRPSVFVFCKLVEETCELSDVLYEISASEPLNGEVADVIISALDLLYVCEYQHIQQYGSMNKDEIFDSIVFSLSRANGTSDLTQHTLEDYWFCGGVDSLDEQLAMINHYKGRITRLLNQPQRTDDNLADLVNGVIRHTAKLACDHNHNLKSTIVKVEHAIEHKVQKWRGKFGL